VLLVSVPVLLVAASATLLAALASRALRDEATVEALRQEVRRVGEVHRAVHQSRARRPDAARRTSGRP